MKNSAQPYQCIWPIPYWTWDQVSLYAFDPPFFNTTIWLINFAVTKINSDEKEENSSICSICKAWKKYHTTKFRKIISERVTENGFISKEGLKRNLGETAAQVNIQPAIHIEGRAWLLCSAVVSLTETTLLGRADMYMIALFTQQSAYQVFFLPPTSSRICDSWSGAGNLQEYMLQD